MASMPLKFGLSDYNNKCSFFNIYKIKNNFKYLSPQSNSKKYLFNILIRNGFIRKYCQLLSSKKYIKEYNRSTVATNGSELDVVVANETSNFEYDDNEWDVGIGNLIINLDADIEKTQDEKIHLEIGMASTSSTPSLSHQIQTSDNLNSSCIETNDCQLSNSGPPSTLSPTVTLNINKQSHSLNNNTNNSLELTISTCKTSPTCSISGTSLCSKMAIEHSSTVDKGLKMKIKRTKPGTKSSEVKHEIVKSNELNGSLSKQDSQCPLSTSSLSASTSQYAHTTVESTCLSSSTFFNLQTSIPTATNSTLFNTSKRTSSNHRREKGRDKHEKMLNKEISHLSKIELNSSPKQIIQNNIQNSSIGEMSNVTSLSNLNITSSNIKISSANDQNIPSTAYSNSSCTVPILSSPMTNFGNNIDQHTGFSSKSSTMQIQNSHLCSKALFNVTQSNISSSNTSNNILTYSPNTSVSMNDTEEIKCSATNGNIHSTNANNTVDTSIESPPAKKSKSFTEMELKEMSDICVGTSIGTVTEPDCLGPCEPGTSVTLEGIVWHETEGGVLVVNITWRGKTYVGTLLDCTRHDWAPPRFCDSPTSDLDTRSTKGRAKRGRAAPNTIQSTDLSNFTETRSSVHSKLRNGGNKGRRVGHASPVVSPSSAAFISPRADITGKRRNRLPEEDDKIKQKNLPPSTSPPLSPVLLECREPNCCKKFKNIDALKYHQSHAHGSIDDDDIKEIITCMSENDESNIESLSPIISEKSPTEKIEIVSDRKNNSSSMNLLEPLSVDSSLTLHITLPDIEIQSLESVNNIQSPIARYTNNDCTVPLDSISSIEKSETHSQLKTALYNTESPSLNHSSITNKSPSPLSTNSTQLYNSSNAIISSQLQSEIKNSIYQPHSHLQDEQILTDSISSQSSNLPIHPAHKIQINSQNESINTQIKKHQIPNLANVNQDGLLQNISSQIPTETHTTISASIISVSNISTHFSSFSNSEIQTKNSQFKVKPTSALMPEQDKQKDLKILKTANLKKKMRKSPMNIPQISSLDSVINTNRDDVQSPAYSDISDDALPTSEINSDDKLLKQNLNKDVKESSPSHLSTSFSMYPYYSQSSYLIQNIQNKTANEYKIHDVSIKNDLTSLNVVSVPTLSNLQNVNIDKKECSSSQEVIESQYYNSNYNTYISPTYPFQTQSINSQNLNHLPEVNFVDEKHKSKSESQSNKFKEKLLDNHQIHKESIEIKPQMNPYQLYQHTEAQRPLPTTGIISDDRRYYIYSGEQRRKEDSNKHVATQKSVSLSPTHMSKQNKLHDNHKNDETKIKQEGVKPTMETQGPPPPPTSQYAFIHPGYIPSHHYSSMSFDSGHMYRNLAPMIVPGTYTSTPYLHQIPRYHAPEDLSRSPGAKALDLLQHHANQYYSNHKIHELQERAIKSPVPKTSVSVPGSNSLTTIQSGSVRSPTDTTNNILRSCSSSQSHSASSKQGQNMSQQHQHLTCNDANANSLSKDSRSPPPQRHVHTHHHTHVGLGYPILSGQYSTPYGDKSPKQWENGFGVDF